MEGRVAAVVSACMQLYPQIVTVHRLCLRMACRHGGSRATQAKKVVTNQPGLECT